MGSGVSAQFRAPSPRDSFPIYLKKTVPPDRAVRGLSFFCRTEFRFQQATGKSLFIRLGSKEYVDYLEQKPNARFAGIR
ncbi:hypothetical protein GCM10023184_43510 [Flaviaesturariibacter amylovorans]|uniref:Uncharacterized protein n=2 Tax=Flaviaesturariibacter amylovorans TaxID=1084520 RepID=A0ABP8HRN5_9BACT